MSFRIGCWELLLVLLLGLVDLSAANMLPYREVVKEALNHSAQIKVKEEEISVSEAEYRLNLGGLYPRISINSRFEDSENLDKSNDNGIGIISGEVVDGAYDPWRSSIYLLGQYDISNWYKKRYEVAYLKKLQTVSTYDCDAEVKKMLLEVTDIFSTAAEDNIKLNYDLEIMQLQREVLNLRKQACNKGEADYEEVLRIEAEVADTEREISFISKDLKENLERLYGYMGKPVDGKAVVEPFALDNEKTADSFPERIESTPEYKARMTELEALRLKSKAAKHNYWPDISIYGRYDFYGSDPEHFEAAVKDMRQTAYTVGIEINLAIYDGGIRKWERKKSDYELNRQEAVIKAVVQEKYREIQAKRAGYAELTAALKRYRNFYNQYAKMLDVTKRAHDFGERSMADVLEMKKDALSVERDLKVTEHAQAVYAKRLELETDYYQFIREYYGDWTCLH